MEKHQEYLFLDIIWNEKIDTVEMHWKRYAKSREFRQALDVGLALLSSKKAGSWLADLRLLGVVPKEDQEWADNDWFPRAISGGIRKMAIIMPTSTLSKMSVKKIVSNIENSRIETSYFDDLEKARTWLSNS